MSGLRHDELVAAFPAARPGVVSSLAAPEDFVIDPLPNLLFTRDSSTWVGATVAVRVGGTSGGDGWANVVERRCSRRAGTGSVGARVTSSQTSPPCPPCRSREPSCPPNGLIQAARASPSRRSSDRPSPTTSTASIVAGEVRTLSTRSS